MANETKQAPEEKVKIEKVKTLAVLRMNEKGWTTEFGLNKVSEFAHYEFRGWGPQGEPGRGIVQIKKEHLESLNAALNKALEGKFPRVCDLKDAEGNRIGEKYLHWSLEKQKEPGGKYVDMGYYAKDGEEPKFRIRDFDPARPEEIRYRWMTMSRDEAEILHECLTAYLEINKEKEEEKGMKHEIVTQGPVLQTNMETGWTLEVNEVSWNGRDPKLDIRDWAPNHERCGKGTTLSLAQGVALGVFARELLSRELEANANQGMTPEAAF